MKLSSCCIIELFTVLLFIFILQEGTKANENGNNHEFCTAGERKMIDCNLCKCIYGKFACTKKVCPPNLAELNNTNNPNNDECDHDGATQHRACNQCVCHGGRWACTEKVCIRRQTREAPVADDLKNTPCGPNDYFKMDCNTCYCNMEKTGYLCTQSVCAFPDSSSVNATSARHLTPPVTTVTDDTTTLTTSSTQIDDESSTTTIQPLEINSSTTSTDEEPSFTTSATTLSDESTTIAK